MVLALSVCTATALPLWAADGETPHPLSKVPPESRARVGLAMASVVALAAFLLVLAWLIFRLMRIVLAKWSRPREGASDVGLDDDWSKKALLANVAAGFIETPQTDGDEPEEDDSDMNGNGPEESDD